MLRSSSKEDIQSDSSIVADTTVKTSTESKFNTSALTAHLQAVTTAEQVSKSAAVTLGVASFIEALRGDYCAMTYLAAAGVMFGYGAANQATNGKAQAMANQAINTVSSYGCTLWAMGKRGVAMAQSTIEQYQSSAKAPGKTL